MLNFFAVRQNNWPPLPSFCPVQPCFYQDINVEIPVEFQKIVRYLYYIWIGNKTCFFFVKICTSNMYDSLLAHVSLYLGNLLVGLLYLFAGGDAGATFGLALIYMFLFTPASYMCWFRPAYKAFRDDSSMYFMVFFFTFFFQFIMSVVYSLGIGGMGSSGLILGFRSLGGSGFLTFTGVLMIIVGAGFGVAAAADFYLLVRVRP